MKPVLFALVAALLTKTAWAEDQEWVLRIKNEAGVQNTSVSLWANDQPWDLAATLIRNATPYFGETTRGLQIYSDTRAEVKIGEMIEVKEPAKTP